MRHGYVQRSADSGPARLSAPARVVLLLRVWRAAVRVWWLLERDALNDVVDRLGKVSERPAQPIISLNRAVSWGLRVGNRQPRCLIRSLVLYSLLRSQGDAAELVIGLPTHPTTADAHAWVEIDGTDVGPLPGSRGYVEMTRYPRRVD